MLVEGGETVHHSFFKENLVNEIHTYITPTIIGQLTQKKRLPGFEVTPLGQELFLQTYVQETS